MIPPKILDAPTPVVSSPAPSTPIVALPPTPGPPPPAAATTRPQPVPDQKSQSDAAVRNGIELSAAHRLKEAITVFGEAIRLDPNSAAAYYDRAGAYYSLGQFKEAIADYDRTLALAPNFRDANGLLKFAQSRLKTKAYIVGGQIEAPLLERDTQVDPSYPRAVREAGIRGVVKVECVINDGGAPTDCRVTESPDPRLKKSAIDAVSQWRYKPALRNGQKVSVMVTLEVAFK